MLYELFFSINISLLVNNSSKIGIFIFCNVVGFNCCGQILCRELVLPVLRLHFSHQNLPVIKLLDVDIFLDATQKDRNSRVVAPECIVECIVKAPNTVGSLLQTVQTILKMISKLLTCSVAMVAAKTI